MIRFDDVLPTLVRLCEESAAFDQILRACVVRDLRGQVRLVLDVPLPPGGPDVALLEQQLQRELGQHFVPPILRTLAPAQGAGRRAGDRLRLATELLQIAEPWEPSWLDPVDGVERAAPGGRWRKLERRFSKQAWLEDGVRDRRRRPQPPWPLDPDRPRIVTFFSFKGGAGRTTALTSCAWQLARRGRQVVVIDLDLEAPGVGQLLGAGDSPGVLDFIVEHLSAGQRDLTGLHHPAEALGEDREKVEVIPAGRLGMAYLEKLARLDYTLSRPWQREVRSPVEQALGALLHAVAGQLHPDYILLDSRAGLHDLAGVSLHGLAHVDVLFTRATAQAHAGLDLTLHALAARKGQDVLCVVVHALAPADARVAIEEEARVRNETYQLFQQHGLYGDDVPAEEAADQPHVPVVLHVRAALERFAELSRVEEDLFSEDYRNLCDRIEELCAPEGAANEAAGREAAGAGPAQPPEGAPLAPGDEAGAGDDEVDPGGATEVVHARGDEPIERERRG